MGAGLYGGGGAGRSDPFSCRPLPRAGAGGAEPSGRRGLLLPGAGEARSFPRGRGLATGAEPGTSGPASVGGQAGDWAGLFSGAQASAALRTRRRGPALKAPPLEAAVLAAERWGLPTTRWPSQTGSGSSQWPAGAEAGGGVACARPVSSPAALGPALRRCWIQRFAGGQFLSAPARSFTRPFSPSRPVASTRPALSRPVSYSARRGPGPDGSVQRRLQGQSLAWGPRLAASGRRRDSGAAKLRRGALPRPLTPTRLRSPAAGAAARRGGTGRGLWRAFSSRGAGALLISSACRGSCARWAPGVGEGISPPRPHRRPRPPRVSGAPVRGARSEGGGREASGCVCVYVCVCGFLSPHPVPSGGWGPLWRSRGPGLACGDRAGPSPRLPATPFPACPRWGPSRPPRQPRGPRRRGRPSAHPGDCCPPPPPPAPPRPGSDADGWPEGRAPRSPPPPSERWSVSSPAPPRGRPPYGTGSSGGRTGSRRGERSLGCGPPPPRREAGEAGSPGSGKSC